MCFGVFLWCLAAGAMVVAFVVAAWPDPEYPDRPTGTQREGE